MGDFSAQVYKIVAQIPAGKVSTYGQIARLMGSPRSARYVGYALREDRQPAEPGGLRPSNIPCHRVVFKDGHLPEGHLFGGDGIQQRMLEEEGVTFADDTHVDMAACLWDGRMASRVDDPERTAPPEDFDWSAELGEIG